MYMCIYVYKYIYLSGSERGGCPPQCNPTGIALERIASWAGYYNNVSQHLVWTRLWCNASPSEYARKMFLRNPFWVTPEPGGGGVLRARDSNWLCYWWRPFHDHTKQPSQKTKKPSNFPGACDAHPVERQPHSGHSHTYRQEQGPVSKSKPGQSLPCTGKDKDPSHARASQGWWWSGGGGHPPACCLWSCGQPLTD